MKTIPSTDLHVLEWSQRQNALHVQPLDASLRKGRLRFSANEPGPDYVILFIGSREQVEKQADAIRPLVKQRDEAKAKAHD